MVSLLAEGSKGVKTTREGFDERVGAGFFCDEVNSFSTTLVLMATGQLMLWVFSTWVFRAWALATE